MLALCLMLLVTYYAFNYAGIIIGLGLAQWQHTKLSIQSVTEIQRNFNRVVMVSTTSAICKIKVVMDVTQSKS